MVSGSDAGLRLEPTKAGRGSKGCLNACSPIAIVRPPTLALFDRVDDLPLRALRAPYGEPFAVTMAVGRLGNLRDKFQRCFLPYGPPGRTREGGVNPLFDLDVNGAPPR